MSGIASTKMGATCGEPVEPRRELASPFVVLTDDCLSGVADSFVAPVLRSSLATEGGLAKKDGEAGGENQH